RTLAVLSFPFAGFTRQYRHRLPDREAVPLLVREESYYRLLRRATDPDPDRRFGSATEMREQLYGVLLEVLSAADGQPRPVVSTRFTAERRAFGTDAGNVDADRPERLVDWNVVAVALPRPRVDLSDPGAGFVATLDSAAEDLVEALRAAPVARPEISLPLGDRPPPPPGPAPPHPGR